LGVYLRCLAGDHPKNWLRWLPWAEYCYNTSYQSALKTTPFEVIYGRAPPTFLSYQPGISKVAAVDHQLQERDLFLSEIRDRLLHAQQLMKRNFDDQHRDIEFQVGDWVWLRLHHRVTSSSVQQKIFKLSPRYYGPYQVIERIDDAAYKLQLPTKARIHNVFHVSFLKKHIGVAPESLPPLPDINHGRALPETEQIVRARLNSSSWELLVHWMGREQSETSWESLEGFKDAYPSFKLEDELFVKDGRNVIDAFVGRQYKCRSNK
jgi:hypothetical protein